ncbi:MAG: hypothetical protein KDB00_16605 [Planctomycetales bacterium]|nr:hypothetical protein [Planctomycetales bacterium]
MGGDSYDGIFDVDGTNLTRLEKRAFYQHIYAASAATQRLRKSRRIPLHPRSPQRRKSPLISESVTGADPIPWAILDSNQLAETSQNTDRNADSAPETEPADQFADQNAAIESLVDLLKQTDNAQVQRVHAFAESILARWKPLRSDRHQPAANLSETKF